MTALTSFIFHWFNDENICLKTVCKVLKKYEISRIMWPIEEEKAEEAFLVENVISFLQEDCIIRRHEIIASLRETSE